MAGKMGLSMSYVHQLEAGKRTPSDAVETMLRMLELQKDAGWSHDDEPILREEEVPYRVFHTKQIPVLSWAHAGTAECFEELPTEWQQKIATDCRDPKAFALHLLGDSMAREFLEGDVLTLMPSEPIYSNCLAVLKLATDGIVFRRVEVRPDVIRMIPLNDRYTVEEIPRDQILWAYPVYEVRRLLWK
jgi:SOS-response transcriptional repressor LexA